MKSASFSKRTPLDRARRKAYGRLLPILFVCYLIAYVDRTNVSIAKFAMIQELVGFNNAVIGFGAGVFFIGYFLLEIPGTLIVEKWSARKWIFRIMITWGIMAALTALVKTPMQFYLVRFLLGLAEAGFFPGVIIYLTHWFPVRDRAKALAYFFIASPIAQMVSPKISNLLLKIGTDEVVNGVVVQHPKLWGMVGWQWMYIAWGAPAVLLAFVVLGMLTDRPSEAKWLTMEEREALERELAAEKALHHGKRRGLTLLQGLKDPRVMLLAGAQFCLVTANYGVEFFLPSILEQWYSLKMDSLTWLIVLPPLGAVLGQFFVARHSDRTNERIYHAIIPLSFAMIMLLLTPLTRGHLSLTILCFMLAFVGLRAGGPAFWSLPNLFLAETAAAGGIGLINSLGGLGGFLGPTLVGYLKESTGSYVAGLCWLAVISGVAALLIFFIGMEMKKENRSTA